MTSPSKIKPFDIFYAKHRGPESRTVQHYFVCIYTQSNDINNALSTDVYGVMVTTNKKYGKFFELGFNDYNVELKFNGKMAYALCDKLVRIPEKEACLKSEYQLTHMERFLIRQYLKKFTDELKRQTNIKE